MPFEPRVTLITLPVNSVRKATEFYEKIGFDKCAASMPEISFFQLNGLGLALYPYDALAADTKTELSSKPSCTLAQNVRSAEEVDELLALAEKCGATIVAPAVEKPWGYGGYFADLDNHLWEVSYVPSLQLDEDGNMWIDG